MKAVNDFIISGHEGWEYPDRDLVSYQFPMYDLMDDCQMGLSLKAIEAHLGMDIRETTVPFDIDRPLTEQEKDEVEFYCDHDVDATDTLDDLRQGYLSSKLTLGKEKGIYPAKALYMTNAKLTAAYLDAEQRPHDDEREYRYPDKLLRQYIPQEVFDFFERLKDLSIPDEVVFKEKLEIMVGDCPCTIAYGGIHGAIPCYREEATETRSIRNKDVASYYPHQMTLNGYCSRNIPSPDVYAATIERRVKAKKAGDKATANALKLVLNTTYGAMLNRYNDLYGLTLDGQPLHNPCEWEYNPHTLLKGHGEKSVMLLSQFYRLTEEEIACIRYHMGAFTPKEEWNDYTGAIHAYPNVLWTHQADMLASHVAGI